jgi:hypothetical protein
MVLMQQKKQAFGSQGGAFVEQSPFRFDRSGSLSGLSERGAFTFGQNIVAADEMTKPQTPPPLPPMQPGTAAMAGVQSGIGAAPAAGGVGIAQGAFGPSFNGNIGVQHPANNIPFLRMFGQGG